MRPETTQSDFIEHIRDPLWSKPLLAEPGDTIHPTVELPLEECRAASARLVSPFFEGPVPIKNVKSVLENRFRELEIDIPESIPEGLYTLEIGWPGGMDRMPKCVKIDSEQPDSFEFIHMADPHVSAVLKSDPGVGLKRVIKQINLIDPAFVLLTGDFTSRYGPDDEVLDASVTNADFRFVRRLLDDLTVPLFVTPGNHDLAYPWLRRAYRRLIARPLTGKHLDYSFEYGGVRFLTYEAFRYYDDAPPEETDVAPTDSQLDWLENELRTHQSASARVLFYHYDWYDKLTPLLGEYNVDLALYGHTSPMVVERVGSADTLSIMDEDVFERGHFRIVSVEDGQIESTTHFNPDVVDGGWAIQCRFVRPNDGRRDRNVATVENNTSRTFRDVCIRFGLRAGSYAVSAGQIDRSGELDDGGALLEVRLDLPAESSKRVEIRPRSTDSEAVTD